MDEPFPTSEPGAEVPARRAGAPSGRMAERARSRPIALGVAAVMVALIVLEVLPRGATPSSAAGGSVAATTSSAPRPRALNPAWPKRVTLITDSVGLGAIDELRTAMHGWKVQLMGRPALMVHVLDAELRKAPPKLPPVVVVGLGYNSLWQKNRADYAHWAAYFDLTVSRFLATLHRAGARKVVWVTLRTPSLSVVPASADWQYRDYAWYFPYVNEQLHRLARLHRRTMVLADWASVSNRPGLTYDAIHLDPAGATLYARVVRKAVLTEQVPSAT
jgi:hypothetical protein